MEPTGKGQCSDNVRLNSLPYIRHQIILGMDSRFKCEKLSYESARIN